MSGIRVTIPNNVKKTIQHIKEITGNNHTDDEIYSMLKECSMEPNETAQKLLLQDTFHEVKRKRDRKKENVNNRESGDSHRKPGGQGRGSRNGRGNFPSRSTSHGVGGGKTPGPLRDSGNHQAAEKGAGTSLPPFQENSKETSPSTSSVSVLVNGTIGQPSGSTVDMATSNFPARDSACKSDANPLTTSVGGKVGSKVPVVDANKVASVAFGIESIHMVPVPTSSNAIVSNDPASSSTVCFSSSDPVLVPSNDSRLPGTVGAIKRQVSSHRNASEGNAVIRNEDSDSEVGTSFPQGKVPSKPHSGKAQLPESFQTSSVSTHNNSSCSRPSSNYGSRSQQASTLQRVGSTKEWKPKPANIKSETSGSSEVPTIPVEASSQSLPSTHVPDIELAASKLQKKLGDLHLPRQHVIIPNHIHVPESERNKLSFGSFDSSFAITSTHISGLGSGKSSTPLSETSEGFDETVEELPGSNQDTLEIAEEIAYPDHPHSPPHVPENLSPVGDVSSRAVPDYNEPKQDTALLSGSQQFSVVHTSPSYNLAFVPPMLGGQIAPFENSESHAHDISRLPNYVVPQPVDPSYYGQVYRSSADSEGRVSPFPSNAPAAKYNGNVSVLPSHPTQSTQEGGNSLVMSTGSATPSTQAAGLMPNSIAVTQQPLPAFRPPTGLHIPHYPSNYIHYSGPFFSPFYVPPPSIPQFLSNGAFPQQPQAGNVYPTPQAAAAMGVKYSLPQYKPGSNAGNLTHMGMLSGYGPYGSSPAGYNPSPVPGGNSATNEDLVGSQFKENNVYLSGQQSEGSAVWIGPGRDISSLPASSFYTLPQGQHVAFTPTQAGHGSFANIYQPAQAVPAAAVHPLLQQSQTMAGAVDMVGPAASVYQQPQHQQVNWPSNY